MTMNSMTPRLRLFLSLSVILSTTLVLSGCYESDEFVNPVALCECGSINFDGADYPLKMAEGFVFDETNVLSRRYHLVADMRSEAEVKSHAPAHDFTVFIEIDSINQPVYYLPQDLVPHLMQQIDHSETLNPVADYTCTNGVFTANGAVLGGTESIAFEMLLREVVDGQQVGFEIPFSGSFTSTID
jgi:hypothetical protein